MTATQLLRDSLAVLTAWATLSVASVVLGGPAEQVDPGPLPAISRQTPFARRDFPMLQDGRWIGPGIAYGPYRDGQRPGGPEPSREELREDLLLMAARWRMIRVYGSVGPTEAILELIREEGLDLTVMLGVWIAPESPDGDTTGAGGSEAGAGGANRREMETAIRLANGYPGIVNSVCVGNETQVSWSGHRVPPETLVAFLREMRARTKAPVSTADDFSYWKTPESRGMAAELDFLVTHAHPLWNGIQLEDAIEWTRTTLAEVRATHPGVPVVLGETGWATQMLHEGEQGRLIKGKVGEAEQADFHRDIVKWVEAQRLPTFFFEAFDENWKGGSHPDEVEKHWGLYRADRRPKAAMRTGE